MSKTSRPSKFIYFDQTISPLQMQRHPLSDRMEYVRGLIAELCLKGRFNDLPLFSFLNSASQLVSVPLGFALCYTVDKVSYLTALTVQDDALWQVFSDAIAPLMHRQKPPSNPETGVTRTKHGVPSLGQLNFKASKKHRIRLFGTKFELIVFRVIPPDEDPAPLARPAITYCPLDSGDPLHNFFQVLFCDFSNALEEIQIKDAINEKLKSAELVVRTTVRQEERSRDPDEEKEELASISDRAFKALQALVDREFEEVALSPLIAFPECPVPNILFSFKQFNYYQPKNRYVHYTYNVQFVLASKQKKILSDTFESMKKVKRSARSWFLPFGSNPDYRERGCFPVRSADNDFWKLIQAGPDKDGEHPIIRRICTPVSSDARTFADYSHRSGAIQILRHPDSGNIGWLASNDLPEKKPRGGGDALTFACFHYLFQLMAPRSSQRTLLTYPTMVNGASWHVTSRLRPEYQQDDFVAEDVWMRDTLFQNSILAPLERHVRRRSLDIYRQLVIDEIITLWKIARERQRTQPNSAAALPPINHSLEYLSQLFPFERVTLYASPHPTEGDDEPRYRPHPEKNLWFTLRVNSYFDRSSGRRFLSPSDVSSQLYRELELITLRHALEDRL